MNLQRLKIFKNLKSRLHPNRQHAAQHITQLSDFNTATIDNILKLLIPLQYFFHFTPATLLGTLITACHILISIARFTTMRTYISYLLLFILILMMIINLRLTFKILLSRTRSFFLLNLINNTIAITSILFLINWQWSFLLWWTFTGTTWFIISIMILIKRFTSSNWYYRLCWVFVTNRCGCTDCGDTAVATTAAGAAAATWSSFVNYYWWSLCRWSLCLFVQFEYIIAFLWRLCSSCLYLD